MWRTFRLAVSAVLVVVLPQQFGQDGLMLLILFLGFFSFRTRRHVAEFQRIIPVSAGPLKTHRGAQLLVKVLVHSSFSRVAPPVSIQPASKVTWMQAASPLLPSRLSESGASCSL